MNRATFNDAIKWLSKYYNYNLSDERIERYWDDFRNEDDSLFADVMANAIPEKQRTFPTPQEIREQLTIARERAYAVEKEKEMRVREPLKQMPVRSRHSSDWKDMLINGLYARPKSVESRERHIHELEAMHEKYPHAGYLEVASEQRRWYRDHGLLDESDKGLKSEADAVELELELIEPPPEKE